MSIKFSGMEKVEPTPGPVKSKCQNKWNAYVESGFFFEEPRKKKEQGGGGKAHK